MEVRFRPIRDRVLVEMFAHEDVSDGGIVIPDMAKTESIDGIVRAVGSGGITQKGYTYPVSVKVGDHVVAVKHGGTKLELDGRVFRCIREADILGVIGSE